VKVLRSHAELGQISIKDVRLSPSSNFLFEICWILCYSFCVGECPAENNIVISHEPKDRKEERKTSADLPFGARIVALFGKTSAMRLETIGMMIWLEVVRNFDFPKITEKYIEQLDASKTNFP
jgi:hypothetical protein